MDQLSGVLDALAPALVAEDDDLRDSLSTLRDLSSYLLFEQPDKLINAILDAYPGRPLFEFIMAHDPVTSDLVYEVLKPQFNLPLANFQQSLAPRLIRRLRDFYVILPPDVTPRELDDAHRSISQIFSLLDAASKLKFSEDSQNPFGIDGDEFILDDPEDDPFFKKKVKKSHKKKKSKALHIPSVAADLGVFHASGRPVPTTQRDADYLVRSLLSEQDDVLWLYLNMLRNDKIRAVVRQIYTGAPSKHQYVEKDETNVSLNESRVLNGSTGTSERSIPSAFPTIRPMRAAEYFEEDAQDLGQWSVIISTRAFQQLRKLDTGDAAIFEIVRKKIRELSHGFFSDSNQKTLVGSDNEVPIFEAKMTRDLRLVYQVDCAPDIQGAISHQSSKQEKQLLRVYGIYTHAQLDNRLWASVASQSVKRGGEYRRRCVHREVPRVKSKGQNVTPPAMFPPLPKEANHLLTTVTPPELGDADYLELHAILALEKFIPYSHRLLDSIFEAEDATHEFLVSEREDEIIYHPSSCLVIGRSGTGKTTTMLFKMIALERAAEAKGVSLRQLFVTQSRVLASRVQEYFQMLLETSGRQGPPSGKSANAMPPKKKTDAEKGLLELDEDYDQETGLPSRYSELEDHHFPLFLTFDQLCKLLEADLELGFRRGERTSEQRKAGQRYTLKNATDYDIDLDVLDDYSDTDPILSPPPSPTSAITRFVSNKGVLTFETFMSSIWRRFDQRAIKGLDPALVFGEFMGVIKGHEMTLDTPNGYLDRTTYENLSERTQSTFARARPRIYSLFESYLKHKLSLGCYDAPQRTHALLEGLKREIPGQQMDFLYVDEAQDNLIIDALLLRLLCRSPHGICFCGDTAQTIALGSSFRFDDLKAFLYRIEEDDPLVKGGKRNAIHPAFFQLSVNYRSHGGIVDAATCVVGVIMKLFPHSIDSLSPEQGLVSGPKPVFFADWGADVRYEQFLFGEANSRIEFGAEQVILVRNDAAREALRAQIGGEIGLILTLYESKGLEFSDVLLYNFFADSSATESEWRVVLNALEEEDKRAVKVPQLDETKHAAIQSELKSLYVGLTRARKHIWIWDSSSQGGPMKQLWSTKRLITVCGPNDPIPQLAVESSEADWGKSGRLLFSKRLFIQARFCFEKANLPTEAAIAYAYQLRKDAKSLPRHHPERVSAFVNVATHFRDCGYQTSNQSDRVKLHRQAAESFLEARDHLGAARSFFDARDFTEAALHYRKGGDFDSSVKVIQDHRREVSPAVAAKIIQVAKVVYTKDNKIERAGRLFDNPDDHLEFLEDLGFSAAKLKLLESLGRFDEAGDLSRQQGDELQAIRYFLQSQDMSSHTKALQSLLDGLWKHFSFGSAKPDDSKATDDLLALASSLQHGNDEIEMFRTLKLGSSSTTSQKLAALGRRFIDKGNRSCAVVSLDRALRNPPPMQVATLDELIAVLSGYQAYGQQLRSIITLRDISGNYDLQKIFDFIAVPNPLGDNVGALSHEFRVFSTSMLWGEASASRSARSDQLDKSVITSRADLDNIIRRTLSTRFDVTLERLHEHAIKARALLICLEFATDGRCHRNVCTRQHVSAENLTSEWFNKRVRAYAQIIMVMDFMRPSDRRERSQINRGSVQRIWLERLFEALHPILSQMGNLTSLDSMLIPEYNVALPLLKEWICERFYQLRPYIARNFLGSVISTSLLAFSLDYDNASHYSSRAPGAIQNHPDYIRPYSKQSVVHDCLIWFAGKQPASLSAGLFFLLHVIKASEIPVDLNSLIHFIERLATQMVINERLYYNKGDWALHNLTLPRTWLVYGLARSYPVEHPQKANFLVDSIGQLMMDLMPMGVNPSDGRYIHEGTPFSQSGSLAIRNVFLSRLFRAIVLLGYNSRRDNLRTVIHRAFSALPQGRRPQLSLCEGYLSARSWDDLARAVRTSLAQSRLDEMLNLMQGQERYIRPIPGLRFVFFSSQPDLLDKIGFYSNPIQLVSKLNPQVEAFVPRGLAKPDGVGAAANDIPTESDQETIGDGEEGDIDETEVLAEAQLEEFVVARTPEEHQAATVIQVHLRRLRDLRNNPGLGGPVFEGYLKESVTLGNSQPARLYRKYYLGPLPHILNYLHKATEQCIASKKQLSQRMGKESHDVLDALLEKIGVATNLRKDLIELSTSLKPASLVHRQLSVELLRDTIRKVVLIKERCDKLMAASAQNLNEGTDDYELGVKGLLQEHKVRVPEKPEKPTLNTEDLYYDDYEG